MGTVSYTHLDVYKRQCLDSAAKAYASGVQGDPALKPYNTLNALPLAWLADSLEKSPKEAASLARRCGETARKSFASSKNFWDAVMSVDAEMTAWLLGSALEDLDAEAESATKNSPALILQKRYEQAVQALPCLLYTSRCV